jgi:hypothetical protein
MSSASRIAAAVLLLALLTVEAGGGSVLALVGMAYVDQARLPGGMEVLVRATLPAAPVLVALGFFLSVVSPQVERPNGLIGLVCLGGLSLAVGVVTLGVGLLRA